MTETSLYSLAPLFQSRQDRTRGSITLSQAEKVSFLTSAGSQILGHRRDRLYYPGSTAGDTMFGVPYPPITKKPWQQATRAEKHSIFAKAHQGAYVKPAEGRNLRC